MPITVTPNPAREGESVTARVTFPKPVPPVPPNDVHIDVLKPDGSWQPVTGYDTIPQGQDPGVGIDLPFSAGNPNIGGIGDHRLRVRWSINRVDMAGAMEETTLAVWARIGGIRKTCLGILPEGWDCAKMANSIGQVWGKPKKG
jgi:hypothetical protein